MTRSSIGGPLDYRLLAQRHRPEDPDAIAREARRLAATGLKANDIAQAIGMNPAAVRELLAAADTQPREAASG